MPRIVRRCKNVWVGHLSLVRIRGEVGLFIMVAFGIPPVVFRVVAELVIIRRFVSPMSAVCLVVGPHTHRDLGGLGGYSIPIVFGLFRPLDLICPLLFCLSLLLESPFYFLTVGSMLTSASAHATRVRFAEYW